MQAVQLIAHEGIAGMRVHDVAPPVPARGEILIDVKASSVNPVDWKIARGFAKEWLGHSLPITLGADVAGVVTGLGADVEGFRVGDPVFGLLSFVRLGAWAGQCIALPEELAHRPAALSFEAAAAMPLVALTTWQALFDTAGIAPGQHVLIHAAAGGVGALAVQMAKARGCFVTGTVSGKNGEFVHALGADAFIDYTAAPFEEQISGVDVVYDCVGGDTLKRSFAVLRPGGMLVSIADTPSPETARAHGVEATFIAVHPDGAQLGKIAEMAATGALTPAVSRVFPLADALDACRASETGHTRGKLVLAP